MGARHRNGLRHAIAAEAARLMAEGHYQDDRAACRKAAARLGETDPRAWPDRQAVEAALREYQALFRAERQPAALARLRRLALEAMRDLRDFQPRLTGAVAKGIADEHSRIRLLLTADTPEQVAMALQDRGIPWRSAEVTLHFGRNRAAARPAFRFQAGETPVELIVLDPADRHDPPRESGGDAPLRGLSARQLQDLLQG